MDETLALTIQTFLQSKEYASTVNLNYLKSYPEKCTVKDLEGGFLNTVIVIDNVDNPISASIVVKRAPSYMKVLGPDFPLSPDRVFFEYHSLKMYDEHLPGSVPRPMFYDIPRHSVIMEHLVDFHSMKHNMLNDTLDVPAIAEAAKILGKIHCNLHNLNMSKADFAVLKDKFDNPDMTALAVDFFFTRPYTKACSTNTILPEVEQLSEKLCNDQGLLDGVKELKNIYERKKECLIHGDFTFSSILVKDGTAKIIDHEFSRVGPASFDVGVFLAHCILGYHLHMLYPQNNDAHRKTGYKYHEACLTFVNTYMEEFKSILAPSDPYWAQFMSELAGFAACELMSRIIGGPQPLPVGHIAGVEHAAIDTAIRLLKKRHTFATIDKLLFIGLMLC